jgi:hypothetical protein
MTRLHLVGIPMKDGSFLLKRVLEARSHNLSIELSALNAWTEQLLAQFPLDGAE